MLDGPAVRFGHGRGWNRRTASRRVVVTRLGMGGGGPGGGTRTAPKRHPTLLCLSVDASKRSSPRTL